MEIETEHLKGKIKKQIVVSADDVYIKAHFFLKNNPKKRIAVNVISYKFIDLEKTHFSFIFYGMEKSLFLFKEKEEKFKETKEFVKNLSEKYKIGKRDFVISLKNEKSDISSIYEVYKGKCNVVNYVEALLDKEIKTYIEEILAKLKEILVKAMKKKKLKELYGEEK